MDSSEEGVDYKKLTIILLGDSAVGKTSIYEMYEFESSSI